MTIRIKKDRIEFDNYTLYETSDGFFFAGQITACQIQDAFQGTIAGVATAGYGTTAPASKRCIISKFPFANEVNNVADVGCIPTARYYSIGTSSQTHGFDSTGSLEGSLSTATFRFPFASYGTAISVGDISWSLYAGSGNSSRENGYIFGGRCIPTNVAQNRLEKFPFATCATSVNVASFVGGGREGSAGGNSTQNGYQAGGSNPPSTSVSPIDKFPFVTDSCSSSVGSLTGGARSRGAGISSSTHGYIAGGYNNNFIDKYSFASDANSSNTACLSALGLGGISGGVSSTTNGYTLGGYSPTLLSYTSCIFKFPFASDTNASCVASIRECGGVIGGTQD